MNRAQLIDDAFNLARSGVIDYEIALNLTQYLEKEEEYVPWSTATRVLGYIDSMLIRTEIYGSWRKFMLKLVQNQYMRINFANPATTLSTDYVTELKQRLFIAQACSFDLEDCTTSCSNRYKTWVSTNTSIPPILRDVILCKAMENGNVDDWEHIWKRFDTSNVGSEKTSFLYAMSCSSEPWLLSKYLNMILKPQGKVRLQDAPMIAAGVSKNKVGRYLVQDFFKEKVKELKELFSGAFILPKLIRVSMTNINTPFELKQLKEFVASSSEYLGSVQRTVDQIIEEGESNVMWMNKNYENIKQWLEKRET